MTDDFNKPDQFGRVWMHCEQGLFMTKASMARLMMFVLRNQIEIGDIYAFNPNYDRSSVVASFKMHPDMFAAFEAETGGKLRKPPRITLNSENA